LHTKLRHIIQTSKAF